MEPELADLIREDSGQESGRNAGSEVDYGRRFARVRRIELVSLLVFLSGIAVVLGLMATSVGTTFLAPSGPGVGLLALGAILVLAGAVAMIANWRCPRCHRYLARATSILRLTFPDLWMRRCPRCGLRLR